LALGYAIVGIIEREEAMKITEIAVQGLFNIFDHVIPLNTEERITIIHGQNGLGKTIILRMVDSFYKAKYSMFRTVPFSKFIIKFDDQSKIEIVKLERQNTSKVNKKQIIKINLYESCTAEKPIEEFEVKNLNNDNIIDFPLSLLGEIIPQIDRIATKTWRYRVTGEQLSLNEVMERFGDNLPFIDKSIPHPEWLTFLTSKIDIRLIQSERLLDVKSSSTVSNYSQEIAQEITSKLAEYGSISQSLDRTFPLRVIEGRDTSVLLTKEELSKKLENLEKTRSRLIEVGLLDQEQSSNFQMPSQAAIDESTTKIFAIYVEDTEKKLNVFKDITDRIEILRNIINTKFAYSFKEINFNKEKGFVFKTTYPSSSPKDILQAEYLSSGEQHELVLLYELLFKAKPNSLVLIDEPEISLHLAWQVEFLKDLQQITKVANLDILMATHSPDIIQDHWDLTVELKRPVQ
jgi:predicted ATP-binding protein involved in virulence